MKLSEIQQEFSMDVVKLLQYISSQGYKFTLGEVFRTPEQAKLNAASGTGILNSLHCQRLAIDINLFKDDVFLQDTKDHEPFAQFWTSLHPNNRWGGTFKRIDGNHYERNQTP